MEKQNIRIKLRAYDNKILRSINRRDCKYCKTNWSKY